MKYSDKLQLLLKGVKLEEIKELEEQEAMEAAEEDKKKEEEENATLTEALAMVKDLESKLASKDEQISKLNKDIEDLNNKKTIEEQPSIGSEEAATQVFKELFNKNKEE